MTLNEFERKLKYKFSVQEMLDVYPVVSKYGLWEEFIYSYHSAMDCGQTHPSAIYHALEEWDL
tara:strand:+ start:2689 stop:2877 length:189 start_codon:yes stop_codon:yes gene_type:complete